MLEGDVDVFGFEVFFDVFGFVFVIEVVGFDFIEWCCWV